MAAGPDDIRGLIPFTLASLVLWAAEKHPTLARMGASNEACRINTVAEGYDPTLGIMHEGRDGTSTFVLDMMEPERPKVDRSVLEL